jgi:quinol monooxygenase YgiN
MMLRTTFLAVMAAAAASARALPADDQTIAHVAIFRFERAHLDAAINAFRTLAAASRRESGNRTYDVFRGIDDPQEFFIVERWASQAALAAHEQSEAFIKYGMGVLVRYATLHDTLTASAFDVAG